MIDARYQGLIKEDGLGSAKQPDASSLKFNFRATFANTATHISIAPDAVLLPIDTRLQFVNAESPRMFGNVKRSGQRGAFCLAQPLAGDNVFQITDITPADATSGDNVKNTMFGLLGGGQNAERFHSERQPGA